MFGRRWRRRVLLASGGYAAALRIVNGKARSGEPPLVRGRIPHLGAALQLGRDAHGFLAGCRDRYGDVFTVFVAGQRMTFVLDPMSVAAVLKEPRLRFAPISDDVMDKAFGVPEVRTRFDLDALDDIARTQLKGEHLPPLTGAMEARLRHELEHRRGASGHHMDEAGLYRLVWSIMFAAGTDAVYGTGVGDGALQEAFETFDRQFPLMVSGLPEMVTREGRSALDRILGRLGRLGEDPSSWMLERWRLTASSDDDHRRRAQAAALWAIHANTIPATFWTLFHLLRTPEALRAVERELDEVLGPASPGQPVPPLPAEVLDRLRLLESAAKESLRLTTGSLTLRHVPEDMTLELPGGAWGLRAGDRVCLAPWFTHHDPEIFAAPYTYRFDRFHVDSGVKTFTRHGERVPIPLMPFGAGHSMCPGRFFAMNEIKLFTVLMLRSDSLELVDRQLPALDSSRFGLGIYPPKSDVRIRW